MRNLIKNIFGIIIFLVFLLYILSLFVDFRAYVNLLIADVIVNGKKSCNKNIDKFNLDKYYLVQDILISAQKMGWETEPKNVEDIYPAINGILIVPVNEIVYVLHFWTYPDRPYESDLVSIQITERNSLSSGVDICFVPNWKILKDVHGIFNKLEIQEKERLYVEFDYGVGSFIL